MSRRRDDRDGEGFAAAVPGVKPLRDRDRLRPRPDAAPAPRAARTRAPRFRVERRGDDVFARAEDVSRRRLADLRAGRIAVEREVDLHGMRASAAERGLRDALARAQRDGLRCVLVIHGAGLHSQTGPVLKTSLPDWLEHGALAAEIQAFATAPARLGGPGASLVLLRRARER